MPGSDRGIAGAPAYTLVDAMASKRLPTNNDSFIDHSFEAESSFYFRRSRIATTIAATTPIASNSSMPGSDKGIPLKLPAYTLVDAMARKRLANKDEMFIRSSPEAGFFAGALVRGETATVSPARGNGIRSTN
jgi:hypothetical protein